MPLLFVGFDEEQILDVFLGKSNVEQQIHVDFDRENRKEIPQALDKCTTYRNI